MVALAECGTHAFLTAEIDAYTVGEKTLAQRLYPRLRADELLIADRGFYSWPGVGHRGRDRGGAAVAGPDPARPAGGRGCCPTAPTCSVVMDSTIRGARRERILAAARAGTT